MTLLLGFGCILVLSARIKVINAGFKESSYPVPEKVQIQQPFADGAADQSVYQIRCACNPDSVLTFSQVRNMAPEMSTQHDNGHCHSVSCFHYAKLGVSFSVIDQIQENTCVTGHSTSSGYEDAKTKRMIYQKGLMFTKLTYELFRYRCQSDVYLLCSNRFCLSSKGRINRPSLFMVWNHGLHPNYTSYFGPLRRRMFFSPLGETCSEQLDAVFKLLDKNVRTAMKAGMRTVEHKIPVWAWCVFVGAFALSVLLFFIGWCVNKSADGRMSRKTGLHMNGHSRRWRAGFGGGLYGASGEDKSTRGASISRASIFRYSTAARQQRQASNRQSTRYV